MGRKIFLRALLTLWLLSTVQGRHADEGPYYKFTELSQNPGIYYEYMGEVKIERVKWKIAITLDFRKWEEPAVWREKQLYKTIDTCKESLDKQECLELIPTHKFNEDIKTLRSLQLDLKEFFLTSTVPKVSKFSPYTHALTKRGAPFEFIGWTSRQLFGSMDAGDRDQLNQDIDKLYERTANISVLAAKQTHIIRSNLESLHEEIAKDKKNLNEQHQQFLSLVNRTKQFDLFARHSSVTETLTRWIYQFEQSLEQTISSYKTLVNSIETASQGHLHPLLFTHEQLQDILKSINGHILPWDHSTVTVDMLHVLSKTSVSTTGGKLIVLLEFPLSDKTKYSQYKIHPLPIPKTLVGNTTSYVSLSPQYSHIIVSHDMQQYLLATREYVDTCKYYREVFICAPSLPFNVDNENSPCEFAMLARPTPATLSTCKLSISSKSIPYWSKLISTDEWLYSVMTPVQMRIMCSEERKAELTLHGTGVLTLRGQCHGYTTHHILYGVNIIRTNRTYLYNPGLTLDLPFATLKGLLEDKPMAEKPEFSIAEKQQVQRWAEREDAVTLQQLEEKFSEIAAQKREKYQQLTYVSGAAISPLILLVILIVIYKHCGKLPTCSICKCKHTNKHKSNRKQVYESETVELPTMRPLMDYDHRCTTCSVHNLTQQDAGHTTSAMETVIQLSPPTNSDCRDLAVYQQPETSSTNHSLANIHRISSMNSLSNYVRPLPIQGTAM